MYIPTEVGANLEFYPCPTGYCRCSHDNSIGNNTCVYTYTNSDPDNQCICGRSGKARELLHDVLWSMAIMLEKSLEDCNLCNVQLLEAMHRICEVV